MSEQDQDPAVTPEHVEVLEETEVVTGAVKWFNRVKGFGFITPPDGSGDIFLHLSALKTAGYESVDEGTTLVCEVARGPKGMQAVRVLEVDASTAAPSEGRPLAGPAGDSGPDIVPEGPFMDAVVKWFNVDKGYGFLSCGEEMADIFIHIKTLRRVGIDGLQAGQQVRVRIGQGPKGPQAAEIETA